MAAEKKRLARWFSGKPRAKPLEGGRQRAVSRGQEAPQRAGMGILAAGPLTPAVVLANAGAPFAASNAPSIRLQSRERSGAPAPRERAVPAQHCGRTGNWKRSETNRSLWPEFRRIPAPRSRLRIRIQRIQSRERDRRSPERRPE